MKPQLYRYVLMPGDVMSKIDGDISFVSSHQLARLYHVPYAMCLVVDREAQQYFHPGPRDILLKPRYDGNYTLPTSIAPTLNLDIEGNDRS